MDQDKIIQYLEKNYCSRRDMLSRIPLGMQPNTIWKELIKRRRSKATTLPLTGSAGKQYWYVTTEKMIATSEKIVATLYEYETDFDPYAENIPVVTLEETFYTSFVEGSQITMQQAMDFLTSDRPPEDIEEQLITNNRLAGSFAASDLCRMIDASFLQELTGILTEGMDTGGREFRSGELQDFVSFSGETFIFPPPNEIPSRMKELTSFLSDPQVHPLIKSATAQAWMILVRPFPEGNERLGRILSNMILLRAGYTFFSEVSLSALIARKSYGYYEAVNNILRSENEGDLTYFIEYFMELLSRALDERALRQKNRVEKDRQAEIEMAHTVLTSAEPEAEDTDCETEISDIDSNTLAVLNKYSEYTEKPIGNLSRYLLNRIKEKRDRFSVSEAADALHINAGHLGGGLRMLKAAGAIYLDMKDGDQIYYRIVMGPDSRPAQIKRNLEEAEKNGTDPKVIDMISKLIGDKASEKENRLGTVLALFLPKGQISYDDYRKYGTKYKWNNDMELAMRLGLVETHDQKQYTIVKHLISDPPSLNNHQKEVVTKMYNCFGDERFSTEMVVATLDYSGTSASACLRQLTMLRILDYSKEDENQYRFLVNPLENPQLFEQVS